MLLRKKVSKSEKKVFNAWGGKIYIFFNLSFLEVWYVPNDVGYLENELYVAENKKVYSKLKCYRIWVSEKNGCSSYLQCLTDFDNVS